MSSAFRAEPRELLTFMTVAAVANQVSVRIVRWSWPGALAAGDPESLLRQMRAREVIREVRRGEDQRAVREREHRRESLARERSCHARCPDAGQRLRRGDGP